MISKFKLSKTDSLELYAKETSENEDFSEIGNLLSNVENIDHDLVIANLPYITTENLEELDREVIDYEPISALNGGEDGLEVISRLIEQLENKKYKDVNLFLEIDSRKSLETKKLLNNWSEVKLLKDLAEKDRYVFAKR